MLPPLLGTAPGTDHPETDNLMRCPVCAGTMSVIERLTGAQLYFRSDKGPTTPQRCCIDSSQNIHGPRFIYPGRLVARSRMQRHPMPANSSRTPCTALALTSQH